MCVRVLVATAVLNLHVSIALVPYLIGPFFAATLIAGWGIRRHKKEIASAEISSASPSNPLQFVSALQMAVLFQIVLFVVRWARKTWGETGVFASAGILGFKLLIGIAVGLRRFRRIVSISLFTVAVACAISLALLH